MKNLTKEQKKRYGAIIAAVLPIVILLFILRLPFYYVVLFYFAAFLISFAFNFRNYLAIWANINFARGNEEAARRLLRAAIIRKTASPVAYHNYALLLARDGNGKEALELLQAALALKPKVITEKRVRLAMGSCHWVMGDIEGAIGALEDMRSRYDYVNAHVLASLGCMYFMNGDTEKALEFTNAALEDSRDNAAAWDNLGQIHFAGGENDKAREAFLTAVSHKPDLADSNYYLGLIAEADGEPEKAREYFEKALGCRITALNTVKREQIEQKLQEIR